MSQAAVFLGLLAILVTSGAASSSMTVRSALMPRAEKAAAGPTCYSCEEAVRSGRHIRQCTRTTTCQQYESCGVRIRESTSGEHLYFAGCHRTSDCPSLTKRASSHRHFSSSLTQGLQQSQLRDICVSCCSGDHCNDILSSCPGLSSSVIGNSFGWNHLLHKLDPDQHGIITTPSATLLAEKTCYSCEGSFSSTNRIVQCTTTTKCQAYESCGIRIQESRTGSHTYFAGCHRTSDCPRKVKRQSTFSRIADLLRGNHLSQQPLLTDLCKSCCDGNQCNSIQMLCPGLIESSIKSTEQRPLVGAAANTSLTTTAAVNIAASTKVSNSAHSTTASSVDMSSPARNASTTISRTGSVVTSTEASNILSSINPVAPLNIATSTTNETSIPISNTPPVSATTTTTFIPTSTTTPASSTTPATSIPTSTTTPVSATTPATSIPTSKTSPVSATTPATSIPTSKTPSVSVTSVPVVKDSTSASVVSSLPSSESSTPQQTSTKAPTMSSITTESSAADHLVSVGSRSDVSSSAPVSSSKLSSISAALTTPPTSSVQTSPVAELIRTSTLIHPAICERPDTDGCSTELCIHDFAQSMCPHFCGLC